MTKNLTNEDAEMDVESLEEARKITDNLRQKMRIQAQQLLTWRRAYKIQVHINIQQIILTVNCCVIFRKIW